MGVSEIVSENVGTHNRWGWFSNMLWLNTLDRSHYMVEGNRRSRWNIFLMMESGWFWFRVPGAPFSFTKDASEARRWGNLWGRICNCIRRSTCFLGMLLDGDGRANIPFLSPWGVEDWEADTDLWKKNLKTIMRPLMVPCGQCPTFSQWQHEKTAETCCARGILLRCVRWLLED